MSAEQDNKAFITGVLNNSDIDFSKSTFGIWISSFQHVNYGIPQLNSGYSFVKPLVKDLVSTPYPITGQTFNFVSLDGKSPVIKFFLTSGVKGTNEYDSTKIQAELGNSYFSGLDPIVVMPDMDFAGKLFRRYEVTGLVKSALTSNNILVVSGEDWEELPNSIYANNTDQDYSYVDSAYSGYSNQSVARYKFLYNDSGKSEPQDFHAFEFPYQLEPDSIVKYRISRRSDPVGVYEVPYFTADGKVIIDYSQYKNEISGLLDGNINYKFEDVKTITLSKSEAQTLMDGKEEIVKSLTGQWNTDESVTGIRFYKSTKEDGEDYLTFSLLASGEYSDVYKASFRIERFFLNEKKDIPAYVLSGYNYGDGNDVSIPLIVGDQVYPRLVEDGNGYNYTDIAPIVDVEEVTDIEKNLQDLSVDPVEVDTGEEEESQLVKTIEENFKAYAKALEGEFGDEENNIDNSEMAAIRSEQDFQDQIAFIQDNTKTPVDKNLIPNYPLPKKTYTRDFFSNYLNSGESYVLTPLAEYDLNLSYAAYGNEYGRLGYYIQEDESRNSQKIFRSVSNTTCKGIYIDQQSFCDGQTAVYMPPIRSDGTINLENGLVTEIPQADGVIKRSNYLNQYSWKNAINYFYSKNYIASFDIYPSFSQSDYDGLFNQVFSEVNKRVGGPKSDLVDQDGFYQNQGTNGPRIFVEREIYTEDYNQFQIEELSKSIAGQTSVITGASQAESPSEKLYCVQSYDASDFTSNIPDSFYASQDYRENFNFDEFIPFSGFVSQTYAGSVATSFVTGESQAMGNLYFEDRNFDSKRVFRTEYITGSASSFTYSNYSNASVWNGVNGGTISIDNQDTEKYSYHLFQYSSSNEMKLVKPNVPSGDTANITESNATVLRFTKTAIVGKAVSFSSVDENNNTINYFYLNTIAQYSNGSVVPSDNVKFNIQAYKYDLTYQNKDLNWVVFNEDPVNNNIFGIRNSNISIATPRFFQDDLQETKETVSILYQFPNGPYTSKNYEGTPVKAENVTSLKNGLLNNLIIVTEGDKSQYIYESNCTIDVDLNGRLQKGFAPTDCSIPNNSITFDQAKRLRITRIRYNFYLKDLTIIGDAGFPTSNSYNDGWEYKLQYRKASELEWKTMSETSSFSVDKFSCAKGVPSPYFYKASDLNTPSYLALVAFKTNLPFFLDDNNFEFRIAKYQKLSLFSDTVNTIKKTNFIPIRVNWTQDSSCEYYNIYQKDFFNNLSLIKTINTQTSSGLALPDIKQSYVNLGASGFGGLNGSGYYDIVVSGIKPSVTTGVTGVSSEYGFAVGDSDDPINVKTFQNKQNYSGVAISNVTYSSLINFNNPENRTSDFNLEPKYDGYYFTSSGANAITKNLNDRNFEAYVLNLGNTTISVGTAGAANVSSNQIGIVGNNGAVTTTSLSLNPGATLDISDLEENQSLLIDSNITISNSSSISSKTIFVINESSSQRTITYSEGASSDSYNLDANKTAKLLFSYDPSPSIDIVEKALLSNYEVQDSKIYQPKTSLVNYNYPSIELGPDSFVGNNSLAIYNKSSNSTSLKNTGGTSVGTLVNDSFNFVSWDGSAATVTQKEYFDDIKVYLDGSESEDASTIIVKDDIEIIVTDFQAGASDVKEKNYFFLKDEAATRDFNIKIRNGSSSFLVPRIYQDFKITLRKEKNIVSYSVLYPTNSPIFEIDNQLTEQLILVNTNSLLVDLNSLASKIKKGTFVYFLNKGGALSFYKKDINLPEVSISQNEVAKAFVVTQDATQSIQVSPIGRNQNISPYTHLTFKVSTPTHLTGALNIIDLNFCGTKIDFPQVSDFAGKELFLLCRNRSEPNVIDPQKVLDVNGVIETTDSDLTREINEIGQVNQDSIVLRVFRASSTDKYPTIEKIPFIETQTTSTAKLFSENVPREETEIKRYFYIDDADSNSFVIRDFYNRENRYDGAVFLQKSKTFTVKSFEENAKKTFVNEQCIDFDYFPDGYANGRLNLQENPSAQIINSITEKGSTTITINTGSPSPGTVSTNDLCLNFAYDNVVIDGIRLNKNRLFKKGYLSDQVFGIYNNKEFFIARSVYQARTNNASGGSIYYYQINPDETDIEYIILPSSVASGQFVFKNWTAREITVRSMTYNGTTYQATLSANEQAKFSYSAGWAKAADTTDLPDNILSVKNSNQSLEQDINHPFLDFYLNLTGESSVDNYGAFTDQFCSLQPIIFSVTSAGATTEYAVVDANSGTIPNSNGLRAICFGRTNGELADLQKDYIVNSFYLFVTIETNLIKRNQTLVRLTNTIYDLTIISRSKVDLSKFFAGQGAANLIPNNWVVPIFGDLQTFYLPNLKYKDIGSSMSGKKVVFVNMVGCSSSSPNKIVNYSDSTTENVYDLNSVVVYEAALSGANYIWQKVTTSLPFVKPAYPKLSGLKGVAQTITSEISLGQEFVYLPNITKLEIQLDSYSNKEFGDIVVFNSASNNLVVISEGSSSVIGSYRFAKIQKNITNSAFYSRNLGVSGTSLFSVVKEYLTGSITEDSINSSYPNLKIGSFIKHVNTRNSDVNYYVYKLDATTSKLRAAAITIADKDFSVLDLKALGSDAPNKKLFVYGSTFVSDSGVGFYGYPLKLKNIDALGSGKFYFFNNSRSIANVYFSNDIIQPGSRYAPVGPNQMIEISSKLVSYSEIHKKGSFYISRRRTDTNYLNRFGIEIIFDSEPQFLHQETNSEGGLVQATEIANLNIALSNLLPYGDSLPFSRSREGQSNRYLFGNNVLCAFSGYSDFYSAEGVAQNLIKKQIVKISSAGHYVFSSSNTNIKVTPDSSNIFLVNNCAKDISVDINNAQAILYRNTVLVISSTGGLRYLKKAKKRDEFYSVLNPKTAISTQREITLAAGIPRSFDLLPILDEDELPQQSYIKILSKDGSSSYVYLFLKDYYSGKDVPTDSAENAVAYEVGIGHETIYKSLFFNPQSSYYTLPGITSGYDYLVEIDEDLFRDLQQLPGLNGETERNVLNPSVKYNGVEYGNGDTFVGGDSPNYEVRYPNYVRLYKVTYEVDKSFPRPGADQKDQIPSETNFDGIPTENVAQDTKALLIESINLKARSLFSSPITWTPIKYQAFWSSSQSAKDIWAIQSINPLKTVTISYPEGSSTSYARFINCTVQKSTFRSAIASYFYEYMSAFQPRKEISNPKSLLISLSDDFTQAQKTKIGQIYAANENAYDYLINTKEFELGNVAKKDLFLNNFDDKDDTQKRIKESDFEISVTVSKLKQLPVLKFDDISTQKIIQIINGE